MDGVPAAAEAYRSRVCLNGEWQVAFAASEAGELSPWSAIRVPSYWRGMGTDLWDLPAAARTAKKAVHRVRFAVPEGWRGRKVRLFFEQVEDCHVVSLNGRRTGGRDYIGVCETVDVTAAVRFGETNELTVATFGKGALQGVSGDVFLEALPRTALDHVLVDTSVRNATLGVRARVAGPGLGRGAWRLACSVLDGDRVVLTLPEAAVGASGEVAVSAAWRDAVPWGFGEYGEPRLYRLKARLTQDGRTVDVKHERFGFREFRTEGDRFLFNGKPIVIRGDLYTRTRVHTEHPAAVAAYLHRMRTREMNFLRCHSCRMENAVWFETADEVGFLVQPEMWNPFCRGERRLAADSAEIRGIWRDYVTAHYNHPSLVSWCVDNESFSVGAATDANLAKIPRERIRAYDRLVSSIRALDPNRIVEINHNYCLWPSVRDGAFSRGNFMVFNIHPYGNLRKEIESEIARTGFAGEVPVLVGEIFAHPKPVDFVQYPRDAYAEQLRTAMSYESQIRSALSARHVAGTVLCGESGDGFFGFSEDRALAFGPWDAFARQVGANGQTNVYDFCVKVPWPSLSGTGVKVGRVPATRFGGGNFGLHLNWFDPEAPMFRASVVDERIRKAYGALGTLPPLPGRRLPEAVVRTGSGGGRFVLMRTAALSGEETGVMSDPRGTVWFRLPGTGDFEFDDGERTARLCVAELPERTDRPGFDYLTWVDLGAPTEGLKAELARPTRKEVVDLVEPGECLRNRSFDYVDAAGYPNGWSVNDAARVATEARGTNGRALVLRGGKAHLTQVVSLRKGATYRISGQAVKRSGPGAGRIHVTSGDYRDLFSVTLSGTVGKTERFDRLYVATGNERYFYVDDRYLGDDTEIAYDDLSIRFVAADTKKVMAFRGGPFPLAQDGTIRNWLVLGPFPNRGDEVEGYEAARTDYLAADGGEAAYRPHCGRRAVVRFPSGFYWQAGTYELMWEPCAFSDAIGSLTAVSLPEAAVSASPANNVAAYLACTVLCDRDREARLAMGSDDGYVVWLNGERIGASLANRGAEPDQERYRVRLAQGENRLMVKAIQEGGEWRIIARLTDACGGRLQGVTVRLEDEPSLLVNGRFARATEGRPVGWSAQGRTNAVGGIVTLRLKGSIAQATQPVRVRPGHRYRIGGLVQPSEPGAIGTVGLRTLDYKWLLRLEGNAKAGVWDALSGEVTVPYGCRDAYFYCMNWYAKESASVDYADVRLVDLGETAEAVVVSPGTEPRFTDGGKALVYRTEADGDAEWRRVDLATGETTKAAASAATGGPCGGNVLAKSANGETAALRIATGGTVNLRFVATGTGRILYETKAESKGMQIGGCHSPALSPDGQTAVYVTADIQPLADIVLIDLKSGRRRQLTTDHADNQTPTLSPDQTRVAWVSLEGGKRVVKLQKVPR